MAQVCPYFFIHSSLVQEIKKASATRRGHKCEKEFSHYPKNCKNELAYWMRGLPKQVFYGTHNAIGVNAAQTAEFGN